jgi:hypothetical protein
MVHAQVDPESLQIDLEWACNLEQSHALLCGPNGATVTTVMRSTGWQPHKNFAAHLQSESGDVFKLEELRLGRLYSVPHLPRRSSAARFTSVEGSFSTTG